MQKRWKLEYAALALCILVCAAVWMTGVLDRETVWDLSLDYEGGDSSFALEDGDEYGIVSTGPKCDLAPGKYKLRWEIESDADGRILLGDSVDVPIQPAEITFHSGMADEEAAFEIRDSIHSFNVGIEFSAGTRLKVKRVRLYSPVWRDNTYTFCSVVLLILGMFIAWKKGALTGERGRKAAILAIAVLISSSAALRTNCTGSDVQFHAPRIMNLADALSRGQIPTRVGGFSYNGYGAVTSVFYPDLFLYPWALAIMDGVSVNWVLKNLIIVLNALCAINMYIAAKGLFKDSEAAVCAAAGYVLSLYRLRDTYTDYMLGEMIAVVFLPVFIWGLWEILWGNEKYWPVFSLASVAIWNSHILTCLLCAGMAGACILIRISELVTNRTRRHALLLSCMVVMMLSVCRLIPLADLWLTGVRTQPVYRDFVFYAINGWELFLPEGYLGVFPWIGLAAAFAQLSCEEKRENRTLIIVLIAGGCVTAWMATRSFPWGRISSMTHGAIDIIQFPRRFCMLTMVCFALAGGKGFAGVFGDAKGRAAVLTLIVAAVSVSAYLGEMAKTNGGYQSDGGYHPFLIIDGHGANPYMVYPEYQLEGTDVNETRSRQPETGDGVTLADYEKNGTRIRGQVDAEAGGEITFPLFGFKGYEARLNGEKIAWRLGENNRLTVLLSAGAKGQLTVDWRTPALWRVCDLISLAAAISLGVYCIKRRREH